jgi:hypothetical protein
MATLLRCLRPFSLLHEPTAQKQLLGCAMAHEPDAVIMSEQGRQWLALRRVFSQLIESCSIHLVIRERKQQTFALDVEFQF